MNEGQGQVSTSSASCHLEGERGLYNKSLFIDRNCVKIEDSKTFLIKHDVTFEDTKNWLRKIEIGKRDRKKPEKVILMVGETGSGKTTFINRMLNHIIGVDWSDEYKVKLIEELETCSNQAISQTNWVTAYTINHVPGFEIPFSLTIIDTPGFGATEGIERDKQTTQQLQTLFTTKGPNGIDHIDAVGFVIQASKARLTTTQKYIYDSVLGLFGKDIGHNIFILFSFADGSEPKALSGITEAQIPFKKYYTFNNVSMYGNEKKNTLAKIYWSMAVDSFKSFINNLENTEPRSLLLTREVLNERKQLERVLLIIERNIRLNTETLETLTRENATLKFHREDLDQDKEFTYETMEMCAEEEHTKPGNSTINCIRCNVTCFEVPSDEPGTNILGKLIQNECMYCRGKCKESEHRCEKRIYVFKSRMVLKTSQDLHKAYGKARRKKTSSQQMIQECGNKIAQVLEETLQFVSKSRICIARLEEIALSPSSLKSTEAYIDLLIQNSKTCESRTTLLQLKEQVKLRKAVLDEDPNPFDGNNMMHVVNVGRDEGGKFLGVVTRLYKTFFNSHPERSDIIYQLSGDPTSVDNPCTTQNLNLKATEKETLWKTVIDSMSCRLVESGKRKVYAPMLRKTFEDEKGLMKKFEVGEKKEDKTVERVIMLFGESGSGKTAIINAFINYILGVQWTDEIRFKLIEEHAAKSDANYLASYTIHHQPWFKISFTITIIDTPGFGGMREDREITNQVATFLSTIEPQRLDRLDAVGFVIKSTEPKLSRSEKYIFESIPGLFEKGIADNILMMTFADTEKPRILKGIPDLFQRYLFNNSALSENIGNIGTLEHWNIGKKSFDTLMTELSHVEPKSLILTKHDIKHQRYLQVVSEHISSHLEIFLSKVGQLVNAEYDVGQFQSEMDRNKDYTYTVTKYERVRERKKSGQNITNCTICKYTCHQNCRVEINGIKYICSAMDWWGNCKMCREKCSWRHHKNQDYMWKNEPKIVKEESKDLRVKYESFMAKKLNKEEMIEQFNEEINGLVKEILKITKEAQDSIDALKTMPLGSQLFSVTECIRGYIEKESLQHLPGWEKRVEHLEKLREQVQEIQDK